MRRVIIVLCLVAALACLAVPAFAVGQGNGLVYWAPINFDRIHLDGVGQYDYPLNWIDTYSTKDNPAYFTLDESLDIGGSAVISQGVGYTSLMADFPCPTDKFDLRADNAFIQVKFLETADYVIFNNSDGVSYDFDSVSISFRARYYYADPSTGLLDFRAADISRTFTDLGSTVDIGELITDLLYSQSWWDDSMTSALLTDLRIDFDMDFTSGVTPCIWVSWNGSTFSEQNDLLIYLSQWGGRYTDPQPIPEVPDIDLGTWLRDTVGAFLDFEIFPGFSVDMIFYLILIIGLVLWFVRIIS